MSFSRSVFQLSYQLSPIIFVNGIANKIPGKMLPILVLFEATNAINALASLNGASLASLEASFAHFQPLPGATLIHNQIGHYPFANQQVAGNAIIVEPLNISLLMRCPVNTDNGYLTKFLTMSALKGILDYHIQLGGMFTILTPSYVYENCVLLQLSDASTGETKQVQNTWKWDFQKPLLTQEAAQSAQNQLMDKITVGGKIDELSWSSIGNAALSGLPSQFINAISGVL